METSLDAFMCDMTHSDKSHDSFKCVTRCIPMCYMTRSFISSVSAVALMETWLIAALRDRTQSYQSRDSFKDVTWLVPMCSMTRSCFAWQDAFLEVLWLFKDVAWLIPMCCMTRSCFAWQHAFLCVTWPVQMCDTTHSYVWRDAVFL